jgi:hypothetical protein
MATGNRPFRVQPSPFRLSTQLCARSRWFWRMFRGPYYDAMAVNRRATLPTTNAALIAVTVNPGPRCEKRRLTAWAVGKKPRTEYRLLVFFFLWRQNSPPPPSSLEKLDFRFTGVSEVRFFSSHDGERCRDTQILRCCRMQWPLWLGWRLGVFALKWRTVLGTFWPLKVKALRFFETSRTTNLTQRHRTVIISPLTSCDCSCSVSQRSDWPHVTYCSVSQRTNWPHVTYCSVSQRTHWPHVT